MIEKTETDRRLEPVRKLVGKLRKAAKGGFSIMREDSLLSAALILEDFIAAYDTQKTDESR